MVGPSPPPRKRWPQRGEKVQTIGMEQPQTLSEDRWLVISHCTRTEMKRHAHNHVCSIPCLILSSHAKPAMFSGFCGTQVGCGGELAGTCCSCHLVMRQRQSLVNAPSFYTGMPCPLT